MMSNRAIIMIIHDYPSQLMTSNQQYLGDNTPISPWNGWYIPMKYPSVY